MDGRAVKAILFDLDNTLIETSRAGGASIQKVMKSGRGGQREDGLYLVCGDMGRAGERGFYHVTLNRWDNDTSEHLKATLGLDDATIHSICDKFKQKLLHEGFDPAAGRSIDDVRVGHWDESLQETVGSSTRSLAAQCYHLWKQHRLELLSLSPETRHLLKQLRTTYKLLLLTNGEAQTQREKVEAVGCEEFFDAIVIGGEHEEQKPRLSIFTLCFNILEVEAQDCVVVGDSLDTDIQGGFNAGVRATVWISSAGGAATEDSVKPDYTIATVLDLPEVLAQLK